MRAKDFIKKENIEPIPPVATNKNTASKVPQASTDIDNTIGQPAPGGGAANLDQAIDQAQQPKGPGKLSQLWDKTKAAAGTAANRFGQGFTQGFASGLGPGADPITAPGAAARADAAALEPVKYAWNLYSKQIGPADVPREYYNKVQQIVKNPPADWAEKLAQGQVPDAIKGPQGSISHRAGAPVNPQVVNYLKQVAGQTKIPQTGNDELDKLTKAAGIQK